MCDRGATSTLMRKTDKERRIFDLLLQVVYHCNLQTQLRERGLEDLKIREIVTPLNVHHPKRYVSLEDPLQILSIEQFVFSRTGLLHFKVKELESRERLLTIARPANLPFMRKTSRERLPPNLEHLVSEEQDKTCLVSLTSAKELYDLTQAADNFSRET
ncbi:hypothetical protein Tco_1125281 [Tanacetum coccineum]|uniref:Uncharacterized protein n=1 Tax=Tanacetum coccineum TaxID=301880 RepID=A0ABQ5J987_9ASTR